MKKLLIGLAVVLALAITAWLLWNLVVALVSGLAAFIVVAILIAGGGGFGDDGGNDDEDDDEDDRDND